MKIPVDRLPQEKLFVAESVMQNAVLAERERGRTAFEEERRYGNAALIAMMRERDEATVAERERCAKKVEEYSCDHQDCLNGLAWEIRKGE